MQTGGSIDVVNDFRDLGTHLCISAKHSGTTLTNRILKGIPRVGRIRWLRHKDDVKTTFVLTASHGASLYGCEAAHINEAAIARYSTATAKALGMSSSARASAELFFNSLRKEVEPWAVVFIRRVSLLRRMLIKNPFLVEQVADTITHYTRLLFLGTLGPGLPDAGILPAPPFGHPSRATWKGKHHAYGPIGELLYSAAHFGCAITPDFYLRQPKEVEFSIHQCPLQYLKPLVVQSIRTFRSITAAQKRTCLGNTPHLDYNLLRSTISSFEDDGEVKRLRWYTTLSEWNGHQLTSLDFPLPSLCDCGHPHPSLHHLIWECPLTEHIRSSDPLINYLSGCDLPSALAHGIPPSMHANLDSLPWDQESSSDNSLAQLAAIAKLCDIKFSFGNLFVRAQRCFQDVVFAEPELLGYNARQLFAHVRGPFGHLDLALPQWVDSQPGAMCATFTDGSLTFLTKPEWSLGGSFCGFCRHIKSFTKT